MKCWPEGATAEAEVYQYPGTEAAPQISWEAFGGAVVSKAESLQDEPGTETPEANRAVQSQAVADELRRSFELGRERGHEEGRAVEREACNALMQAGETRRIEDAARLVERFTVEQTRYFETVEREVVKLALAIAARNLRREAQMDPLVLSGAVRVALGQLSASTQSRLRVPACDLELWRDTIANLPNLPVKPDVMAGDEMSLGECVLETELGSVDLRISSQISQIERSFLDSAGTHRGRSATIEIAEDMSE
jgi:flagellar assembly protein FliH